MQPQPAAPMGPSAHSTWGYQPHVNFSNPVPLTAYVSGFQNGYQATYGIQNNSYPGEPPAFRSTLSDTTYNTINTTTITNSASGKRKNTSKGTTASKRRNLGSDANAQASHTPSTSSFLGKSSNQPAVPGIGPKVVDLNLQANPSLRPAFSHKNGFLVLYLLSTAWLYLQMTNNFSSPKLR